MAGDETQSLVDMPEEPLECPVETQLVGNDFFRFECSSFTLRQSFWNRASKNSGNNRASCQRMSEDSWVRSSILTQSQEQRMPQTVRHQS
jgi:hypothetical protein